MDGACNYAAKTLSYDATIIFIVPCLAIKALFLLRTSLPSAALVGKAGKIGGGDNDNDSREEEVPIIMPMSPTAAIAIAIPTAAPSSPPVENTHARVGLQ